MKFIKLRKWKLDKALFGLLFFAQRMDELLFDYTLDTYKPSALNPPFLCDEALKLIEDIENDLIDEKNLEHVLEELKWSIRNDRVSKSLLDVEIEKYFLDRNKNSLYQQKLRLEVLYKTLEPYRYLEQCNELLKASIINIKKSEINDYARTLVTTYFNLGVSKSHLYNKTKEYFFNGNVNTIKSAEQIDDFFESIFPYQHDFKIYFIVSDLVKKVSDSVKAFNIEILDELPAELQEIAATGGFLLNDNETYVEIKDIRTFDCYSAREEADRRLDMLKDLFTLFYHKNQITWKDETLISQCCVDIPVIIKEPKNAMEKAFDMKPQRASKHLNWLIENIALKFSGSIKKFNRIVDLHGICVENAVPENQLLNLWISIETLVPSHVGRNKISNIILSITPFIRVTYINRLIERFVSDLMIWNKYETKRLLKLVPNSKGKSLSEKALFMLVIKSNENIRDELYKSLKDFHLLRYRAYSLSKILGDIDKLKDLLNTHDQKVAWQLRRIYRTRNLIVHSGRTLKYIGTLIENGHDYLDIVLSEIMSLSCGDYRVETLEQVFELEKVLLNKFEKTLSEVREFDEENSLFLLLKNSI